MPGFWTPDTATKALRLVQPIVLELVARFGELRAAGRLVRQLQLELEAAAQGVAELEAKAAANGRALEQAELRRADLAASCERRIAELEQLGLQVGDLELGQVGFPALLGGLLGYLVWEPADGPRVAWWAPANGTDLQLEWTSRQRLAQAFPMGW